MPFITDSLALSPSVLAVSLNAEKITPYVTNSILVAVIVVGFLLLFVRRATRSLKLVPDTDQNIVEFVVEFLYGQVEQIVGKHLAPKCFPLLATLFIFILVANWFGLIPGVGTIGFGDKSGPLTIAADVEHFSPLLRPATAGLNMTLGMAAVFMLAQAIRWLMRIG